MIKLVIKAGYSDFYLYFIKTNTWYLNITGLVSVMKNEGMGHNGAIGLKYLLFPVCSVLNTMRLLP